MVTAKSTEDVRIIVGEGRAVTFPASVILKFRDRITALEAELRDLKAFAEGHHAQQESCVWLHALTIDMPHRIEVALTTDPEECAAVWLWRNGQTLP